MAHIKRPLATQPALIAADDVDLIRFERNLLQIGFFGADESRTGKPPFVRKLESTITRNGERITALIEFASSKGLPTTADRDKFMVFLKIAYEQKARYGIIMNPVRFVGYRFLKELGVADAGSNYEDLNAFLDRMSSSTISSKSVVLNAKTKKYANSTIHVFESFRRVGNETGKKRVEEYEVELAGWLLDNLNFNYTYLQDITTYRRLTRPTAKGIYCLLHWWFTSSDGRPITKDYRQLCMLLGIKPQTYLSDMKRTMGKALDELVGVKYLSRWEIEHMVTKDGYKIAMWAGTELQTILARPAAPRLPEFTTPITSLVATVPTQNEAQAEPTMDSERALIALETLGVTSTVAKKLVKEGNPIYILDVAEYVSSQVRLDKDNRISNPAGILIYYLRNDFTIPAAFQSSRLRRSREEAERRETLERQQQLELEIAYEEWKSSQVEAELQARFPGEELDRRITALIQQRLKTDKLLQNVGPSHRPALAKQHLVKEVREEMNLPTLEKWCSTHAQQEMFTR